LPRDEEKRAAELSVETSKLMVEKTQAAIDRLRPLRERGEIAQSQLFEAETAVKEAQLQQRSAEAQLKLMETLPRPELIAEGESKINAASEALNTSTTRLDHLTIRAPISGVLTNLACHPGQTCSLGTSIGEIVDSREVLAVVWVPVTRSRQIKIGSVARVQAASTIESSRIPSATSDLIGKVKFVGHSVDLQTGNVPVHILVQNDRNMLVVGQTIAAEVFLGEPTNLLCVPAQGIHDEGNGSVITVVREAKAVVLRPQLGVSNGAWTAVSNIDLKPGELVVTSGAYNLPEGTQVKVENTASKSPTSE